MNRLTKQISLVLISSSLILHGCQQPPDKDERKDGNAPASYGAGYSYHGGGYHFFPFFHSGGVSSVSGGRTGAISSSARGGFGSSAHGVGS